MVSDGLRLWHVHTSTPQCQLDAECHQRHAPELLQPKPRPDRGKPQPPAHGCRRDAPSCTSDPGAASAGFAPRRLRWLAYPGETGCSRCAASSRSSAPRQQPVRPVPGHGAASSGRSARSGRSASGPSSRCRRPADAATGWYIWPAAPQSRDDAQAGEWATRPAGHPPGSSWWSRPGASGRRRPSRRGRRPADRRSRRRWSRWSRWSRWFRHPGCLRARRRPGASRAQVEEAA